MEAIEDFINSQGQNISLLDLEYKQIEDLDILLPILSNLYQLKELNLHGNRLKELPEDISSLEQLQILDISNNMFQDIEQTVAALCSLPKLQNLNMQLQSHDEEAYVIQCLPNLLILNQREVRHEEQVQAASDRQSENASEVHQSDITLQQEDLEHMAILFDNIRELFREVEPSLDQEMQLQFDQHVRTVMKDLQNKITKETRDSLININILQAKYNLYEICYMHFIKYLSVADKRYESITHTLHNEHQHIFRDIISIKILKLLIQDVVINMNVQEQPKQIPEDNQVAAENNRLKQELHEAQQQIKAMEKENRKYLDMIIRHSKGDRGASSMVGGSQEYAGGYSRQPQQTSSPKKRAPPANLNSIVATNSVRNLTLRQLKEVVSEIYDSKQKYDLKYQEAKLPRETMEQHMYTFLNQKYGLKNLIIEWATSIINGLKKFSHEDNDIAVFGKILRNECDEEFRFVQTQVKNTMEELLKMYLRGKFPLKHQKDIKEMLTQRIEKQIYEEEAVDIIKYMYNQEDSEVLLSKIRQHYVNSQRSLQQEIKGKTREEQIVIQQEKETMRIDYSIFQKVILDFQQKSHERYLKKFVVFFKQVDLDQNGIVNEIEFRELVNILGIGASEIDVQKYLNVVDPYSHQQITFSQCVALFSNEAINTNNGPISILQKISEN